MYVHTLYYRIAAFSAGSYMYFACKHFSAQIESVKKLTILKKASAFISASNIVMSIL